MFLNFNSMLVNFDHVAALGIAAPEQKGKITYQIVLIYSNGVQSLETFNSREDAENRYDELRRKLCSV